MAVKINVSMPEEILRKLDEAARESKSSRGVLLSLAVKHFLEKNEEDKQRECQRQAAKQIDQIRESVEPWDATSEVLKWRDRH